MFIRALAAAALAVAGSAAFDLSSIPPLPFKYNMTYTPAVLVDALGLVVTWTHSADPNSPSDSDLATYTLGNAVWAIIPVGVALYAGGTATVMGTLVYIIGGSEQGVLKGVDNVWVFDVTLPLQPGCLTALDPVPVGISAHAAVAVFGKIYVAGGYAEYGARDEWGHAEGVGALTNAL